MTIAAEQESGAQPDWIRTVKIGELSGEEAGYAIAVGEDGSSAGWSWTMAGLLVGVTHEVAGWNKFNSRVLGESTLKIMIRRDPKQVFELKVPADALCQISPGTDPGKLHHGITQR